VAEVVAADQFARLVKLKPAQRRLLVLRRDRPRVPGGQEVPQVRVLVLWLARRRGHVADHRVPQRRVGPRDQVGEPGLLRRLAQRDLQRVGLSGVAVPADLEPHAVLDVPAQQHPAAFRVQHERGGGEVQRQRPRPRIARGGGQAGHSFDVGGLGLPRRPVSG
jgi:hypothetical protein